MPRAKTPDALTFERAFEALEATVQTLEQGDLPLEQALAAFERGQALAARCAALLEQAELRLSQLAPDEPGGLAAGAVDLDDEDD
jgi:exodeoxyribonuclease VII small subunit